MGQRDSWQSNSFSSCLEASVSYSARSLSCVHRTHPSRMNPICTITPGVYDMNISVWIPGSLTQIQTEYVLNTSFCLTNMVKFERQSTFRRNKLHPYSDLCLSHTFTLISCFVNSSTLKMDAIFSSETSVDFQHTTRHYIHEDKTYHNDSCETLKSCVI
jgi:hypothetical protein